MSNSRASFLFSISTVKPIFSNAVILKVATAVKMGTTAVDVIRK